VAAPSNMRKMSGRSAKEENIPLTSMMDIFTNMLLFLIMSFSATGALMTKVDQLDLPLSNIDTGPRAAVSIVVDSGRLSGVPGVYAEEAGQRVQLLDEGGRLMEVPAGQRALDPNAMLLPGLMQFLQGKAEEGRQREAQLGIPFTGEIIIQADAAVNYNSVLKVLATCGTVGFDRTEFVVIKGE
jgi:biopolymer transport protein ExbD